MCAVAPGGRANSPDLLPSNSFNCTRLFFGQMSGERFPAKFGRTGFRRNFPFDGEWNGKRYATKQIEAYAVEEEGWLVITVIVKFF
jgi:hypothetical protein